MISLAQFLRDDQLKEGDELMAVEAVLLNQAEQDFIVGFLCELYQVHFALG